MCFAQGVKHFVLGVMHFVQDDTLLTYNLLTY